MLRGGGKASERRRLLSDSLRRQQDQALSSSLYLLRQIGPTGFLLREEEPDKGDFRVTTAPPTSRGLGPGRRPRNPRTRSGQRDCAPDRGSLRATSSVR